MKVYSLKNCDTCKKALKWLDGEGIAHEVHDIRAQGVDAAFIGPIVDALGWETAINRRSTTWRGLSDADKDGLDNAKAVALILDHPTLMKRPVFVSGSTVICGFDAKAQAAVKAL
ncbi:UNVERIFIED_CONTAM: hypothetical protein GTU68_021597 [Idotea baltica]|nr:hypothetical protein [Idotea baltica]